MLLILNYNNIDIKITPGSIMQHVRLCYDCRIELEDYEGIICIHCLKVRIEKQKKSIKRKKLTF